MPPRPLITLLTDFGDRDAYVGIMKGIILGIAPNAAIVDLSHSVPPQDVVAGALTLRSAVASFAPGTIHVAVIDPGVGSDRAALLVETPSAWLIGPDNGVLWPSAVALGIEAMIELTEPRYRAPRVSATFHGRDIFAPAAAHLAAGVEPTAFGPQRDSMRHLELPIARKIEGGLEGSIIHVDHFGNLITNVGSDDLVAFSGTPLSVSIGQCADVPVVTTYADVEAGALAAVIGSWGHLEIAVRNGSAAQRLAATVGTRVTVRCR